MASLPTAKSHWDVIAAIDFTSVEVWNKGRLVTFYLLFVMELRTRRVYFAGCTTNPHVTWVKQMARELTNHEDGFLNGRQCLIMDRDTKFSESFWAFPGKEHVEPVRLPPSRPNMNAHLERLFGSLKPECLDRLILFVEDPKTGKKNGEEKRGRKTGTHKFVLPRLAWFLSICTQCGIKMKRYLQAGAGFKFNSAGGRHVAARKKRIS